MKTFARVLATILCVTFAWNALAQESYPSRPIRLIVPFPPGAGTDGVARFVAQKLSEIGRAHV